MNKPNFAVLRTNYPSNKSVKQSELFKGIGWDDLIGNPTYENTCAIRVSLALVRSGVPLQGRMKIKTGPHKDQLIEPAQKTLSEMLASDRYFGRPERFLPSDAAKNIGYRHGIISFMKVPGYNGGRGGHIDITSVADGGFYACGSDCYWGSAELWFWAFA